MILHPEELHDAPITRLKHLPLCILVKLDRSRVPRLSGLGDGVVPIEPIKKSFTISYTLQRRQRNSDTITVKTLQKTVQRRQFPVTGACAFTDYRSQGQAI